MPNKSKPKNLKPSHHFSLFWQYQNQPPDTQAACCPYCQSREVVKRGQRKNKYQSVQLYQCKHCQKAFTKQLIKNKHYPLKVILEAVSLYNLGYSQAKASQLLKEKYGLAIKPSTISNWKEELKPLCRYDRLRSKAARLYPPPKTIQSYIFRHQQVYYYRCHQAKLDLLLQTKEFAKFKPLKTWLQTVKKNCPHDLFQAGERSSRAKAAIALNQVQVNHIKNHATRLAQLVLQAVGHNRLRHKALQQFMLANDSVTVAMEIPVYLKPQDIKHFKKKQNFQIPFPLNQTITDHIDLL